jgi:pimeloyl-ACP methyl ester carboxylesterase
MPVVRSRDGTVIAYQKKGRGQPLIFVHGSASDGKRWQPILPMVEDRFTAYMLDRRGYGKSGDAQAYSMEAEIDDIVALAESIKSGPVDLIGHSYGALCSLSAACRGGPFRRLVLYEPPLPMRPDAYFKPELPSTMREAISRGDEETAMIAFATQVMGATPQEIAGMRRLRSWKEFVRHAARVLRELEVAESLRGKIRTFGECRVPTLVLLGAESSLAYRDTADGLRKGLRLSRLVQLIGQKHAAINAAPKLFADELVRFLTAPSSDVTRTRVSRSRVS